jgi:hypothetical protein
MARPTFGLARQTDKTAVRRQFFDGKRFNRGGVGAGRELGRGSVGRVVQNELKGCAWSKTLVWSHSTSSTAPSGSSTPTSPPPPRAGMRLASPPTSTTHLNLNPSLNRRDSSRSRSPHSIVSR